MPRLSVMYKTLRDLRWQVIWYGLGLGLMAAFIIYIFPSYSSQLANIELPEAMRAMVGNVDYGTAKGFVSAEFLSWTPLVLVVFAIMGGTGVLAGEETNGTLDLVLAQPISRTQVALEKLLGLLIATLEICAIIYAGWLVSVPFVTIDLSLGELAIATLNLIPVILFFQAFSMWAGVTLPSRGLATGTAVALAVASYFVYYLGNIVDALEPLRWLSVFYHYHGTEILTDGVHWGSLALLLALYVFFAGWALMSFQRRDLGVNSATLTLHLPWSSRSGAMSVQEAAEGPGASVS
jgi:beta-exotoxin I transport system permease protein